jgi:uncharacterized membrane protein
MLQSQRWCDNCHLRTEQRIHLCGSPTRRAGGIAWLDNDGVNFLCSASGGLLAMLLAR